MLFECNKLSYVCHESCCSWCLDFIATRTLQHKRNTFYYFLLAFNNKSIIVKKRYAVACPVAPTIRRRPIVLPRVFGATLTAAVASDRSVICNQTHLPQKKNGTFPHIHRQIFAAFISDLSRKCPSPLNDVHIAIVLILQHHIRLISLEMRCGRKSDRFNVT